tara:strand:- start:912 stop:1400 length:489 start_codon:yes stop_codon:yes gene_type:complete
MNNQLLFFGLAAATVLVFLFLLVSRTFEPYTQAAAFASGNNFITLGTKGDIKLQPVVDVDNAIDAAAGSVAADVAVTYKTKASASSDGHRYDRTFQTKAAASANKTSAAAAYQPKGNYLVRGQYYRIWNKEDNQNVLRWGDQIKADTNRTGTNQYRYFKIDN